MCVGLPTFTCTSCSISIFWPSVDMIIIIIIIKCVDNAPLCRYVTDESWTRFNHLMAIFPVNLGSQLPILFVVLFVIPRFSSAGMLSLNKYNRITYKCKEWHLTCLFLTNFCWYVQSLCAISLQSAEVGEGSIVCNFAVLLEHFIHLLAVTPKCSNMQA